jgi:hypothetical protein
VSIEVLHLGQRFHWLLTCTPGFISQTYDIIRVSKRMKDDDDPFIVLTETKSSIRYIPVWARYSPLIKRMDASRHMGEG